MEKRWIEKRFGEQQYKDAEEDTETFGEALKSHRLGPHGHDRQHTLRQINPLSLKLLTIATELRVFIRDRGLDDTLISLD